MRFWKLLTQLWSWGDSNEDRRRESRRSPSIDCFNEADLLEDRNARTAFFPSADAPDRRRPAEVIHLSMGHRHQQVARTRSQVFQLSVVAVDYLLEHEWFWLLTGRHKPRGGETRGRRPPRSMSRRVIEDDPIHPADESNRTICVTDSAWSIVAAIEQTLPASQTTTEAE